VYQKRSTKNFIQGDINMFNPIIIVAILIQTVVAKANRLAGAVLGFVITTGILLWGLGVYADGSQIALFGIPLSQPIFLIACLVWFWFDAREFSAARKITSEVSQMLDLPLLQSKPVMDFYQTSMNAWSAGKLSNLGKGFENEGKLQYDAFVKKYPPFEGSALRTFFEKFMPREGEFLVGVGNLQTGKNPGWFVLTSQRLVQRDDMFKEVVLSGVDTYQIKGMSTKKMIFKMKSGAEIDFEKVQMFPVDKFLKEAISQSLRA
jgi:hypothetical protein